MRKTFKLATLILLVSACAVMTAALKPAVIDLLKVRLYRDRNAVMQESFIQMGLNPRDDKVCEGVFR